MYLSVECVFTFSLQSQSHFVGLVLIGMVNVGSVF